MPVDPALWDLDADVVHLNHASYGAVPRPVAEARDAAMRRIEASPERFYRASIHDELAAVREQVATFLGAAPDATALVTNVTEAIEVVLRAVELRPGDRVLLNDHAYPWVVRATQERAAAVGAEVALVAVPDPSRPDFDDAIVAGHLDAVDERTRLVVVDQITSATAPTRPGCWTSPPARRRRSGQATCTSGPSRRAPQPRSCAPTRTGRHACARPS